MDDNTAINLAQNETVKEDFSKIIAMQMKVCGDNSRWRDINGKQPVQEK